MGLVPARSGTWRVVAFLRGPGPYWDQRRFKEEEEEGVARERAAQQEDAHVIHGEVPQTTYGNRFD